MYYFQVSNRRGAGGGERNKQGGCQILNKIKNG